MLGYIALSGVLLGQLVARAHHCCSLLRRVLSAWLLCNSGQSSPVLLSNDIAMLTPAVLLQGFRSAEEVQRFSDMMEEMCYIVATKHSGSLKVRPCTSQAALFFQPHAVLCPPSCCPTHPTGLVIPSICQ